MEQDEPRTPGFWAHFQEASTGRIVLVNPEMVAFVRADVVDEQSWVTMAGGESLCVRATAGQAVLCIDAARARRTFSRDRLQLPLVLR